MGQRLQNTSTILILLMGALFSLFAGGRQAAFGVEIAIPPRLAATANVRPILIASASQEIGGDMMAVQETRSADAPAAPNSSVMEQKSISLPHSRQQRRRKPKMAGIPSGSQAVVQVVEELAQGAEKTDTVVRPQKPEEDDPFAPVKPVPQALAQKPEEDEDPFAPAKPGQQAQMQESKQKPEEDDPFAPAETQVAAQDKTEPGSGKRYGMAPIRWQARISESLGWLTQSLTRRAYRSASTQSTLTHVQTAEVDMSSYLLHPYFATVGGGIGVVSSTTSADAYKNRSNTLIGKGSLLLFSKSRFPFKFDLSVRDSRVGSGVTSENALTKTLNVTQDYRPKGSMAKYKVGYDRFATKSTLELHDLTESSLYGTYSTKLGKEFDQPFEVNARRTMRAEAARPANDSTINRVTAKHVYLPPDSLLSLDTNASFIDTKNPGYRTKYMLANTRANWQPESEDIPLFVTGDARVQHMRMGRNGAMGPATLGLLGDVSGLYLASRNLTYRAGMGVSRTSSGTRSTLSTSQSGNVSYRSDRTEFGRVTYSWNSGGSVFNKTGARPTRQVSGNVGHNAQLASVYKLLGKPTMLRYRFDQSLSYSLRQPEGQTGTFYTSGEASWVESVKSVTANVSARIQDARIFGKDRGHTQSVVISGGARGGAGYAYRSTVYGVVLDADASLTVTRPKAGKTRTIPAARGSATYNYSKDKVFGVRGLRYSGTYRANALVIKDSVEQYPKLPTNLVGYETTQNLSYKIGMNEASITGRLATDQKTGTKNASLYMLFRAWRTIGN